VVIKLILASASPRRKELLAHLLKDFSDIDPCFSIVPAHIDESLIPGESPEDYVTRLAREKAAAVANKISPSLTQTVILAADTSVVIENQILGKPQNDNDAFAMLTKLSGQTHSVITGYALDTICNFVKTRVSFRKLSDLEIQDYIATGEPQDKAGAYAIQGGAALFVDHIEGSLDNVVGLPTESLRVELTNLLAKRLKSR
jgi:septum formation protein